MKWVQDGPDWELRRGRKKLCVIWWMKNGRWALDHWSSGTEKSFRTLSAAKRAAESLSLSA